MPATRFDIRPATLASVVGLQVARGVTSNQLTWDAFGFKVAIYGGITNNRASSSKLGETSSSYFTHVTTSSATWYYWVIGLDSKDRQVGTWNPVSPTGGLQATARLTTELELAAGAVTAAKLAVAAISPIDGKLVSDAVSTVNIKLGAVTAAKTALAAINSSTGNLAANSVTANNIVAGTITANEISASYVYAGSISANQMTTGSLSANRISGGTIDANVVNVTNLNASNINAGTMSADRIYGGTIGASVAYLGTIDASKITTGSLSANRITGGTLAGASIAIATSGGGYALNVGLNGTTVGYRQLNGYNISANNLDSPATPAIKGTSINTSGTVGVHGHSAGGGHGVRGTSASTGGLVGTNVGYDFYAEGGGTNYGPFTGAHDAVTLLGDTFELGDIMVDVACVARRGLSNTLFRVERSSVANQRAVVGVLVISNGAMLGVYPPAVFNAPVTTIDDYGNEVTSMDAAYDALKYTHALVVVNALGEGQMNVCGEGGNLEAGDLIVTSSLPGKGMKQSDDIVRGYTVAKCREHVTFDYPNQVKQVACIYLSG